MSETKKRLDKGTKDFVDRLGRYYENYGIPRIGGRIIGLVLASERPVTAEEIAALLDVSRGSVSTNLKLLQAYGFLEADASSSGRADAYTLSPRAWENAIRARIEGFRDLKALAQQGLAAAKNEAARGKIGGLASWADAQIAGHEAALKEWTKKGEKR
jgi:Predicted transcriptional regulators